MTNKSSLLILFPMQTLENSRLPPKMFSKSEDELSGMESYDLLKKENLLKVKHISNSTGSLNTPKLTGYKKKGHIILKSFLNLSERSASKSPSEDKASKKKSGKSPRYSRHQSEPPDMYSSQTSYESCGKDNELVRQASDSAILVSNRSSMEMLGNDKTPQKSIATPVEQNGEQSDPIASDYKSSSDNATFLLSPATKSKLRCLYAAHTSTPSNLLRKSLASNDYILTPITDDDKSMSPITQSATKMTKAMQVYMLSSIKLTMLLLMLFDPVRIKVNVNC